MNGWQTTQGQKKAHSIRSVSFSFVCRYLLSVGTTTTVSLGVVINVGSNVAEGVGKSVGASEIVGNSLGSSEIVGNSLGSSELVGLSDGSSD